MEMKIINKTKQTNKQTNKNPTGEPVIEVSQIGFSNN